MSPRIARPNGPRARVPTLARSALLACLVVSHPAVEGGMPARREDAAASREAAGTTIEQRAERVLDSVRGTLRGPGIWADPEGSGVLVNRSANDLGKHWWPRLFADLGPTLEAGEDQLPVAQPGQAPVTVRDLVRALVRNAPEDRPPERPLPAVGYLFFSPVGLGAALHRYPGLFDDADLAVVAAAALDPDPALSALNLRTGEGTENHVLMGRTGGYLIAEALLALPQDHPVRRRWEEAARRMRDDTRHYLVDTVATTYERGLGEWDSSTYYPYVIACWILLHDHAPDPEVRAESRRMLDWIAATMAHRWTAGVFGGPEQRSGVPLRPLESNLDQLAWLWFGAPPNTPEAVPALTAIDRSQLVYLALSSYRPPASVVGLARRHDGGLVPAVSVLAARPHRIAVESKPSYLVHGAAAVAQESRILFEDAPRWSLGASVVRPNGGWSGGDSQEVLWKLVTRPPAGSGIPASVLTGPRGRDPWRQVGLAPGVLVDVWYHPEDARALRDAAFAQNRDWHRRRAASLARTFPGDRVRGSTVTFQEPVIEGRKAVLRGTEGPVEALPADGSPLFLDLPGGVHVAVRAVGAGLGPIPPGGFGGFVLEMGGSDRFADAGAFREAITRRDQEHPPRITGGSVELRTLAGLTLTFRYGHAGTYTEPEYDWGFGDIPVGGLVIPSQPPYEFPDWPEGTGHGRVPQLLWNGEPPPRLDSPALVDGERLEIRDGRIIIDGRPIR